MFTNRERANSFGGAAQNYDTYRPRYPDRLIDDVLAPDAHRVLEAGAGTGIASMQMIERGADVLAVEPDTRMAAVAQAKGIPVELATFEDWDPAGRRFDLVVFAASFHWVDPAVALPKIRGHPQRRREAGADLEPATANQSDARGVRSDLPGLHGRRNPQAATAIPARSSI